MYERETKRLVKKIKKVVFKLIKINKIRSRDIKIIVLIKKAKTVLLKDTE